MMKTLGFRNALVVITLITAVMTTRTPATQDVRFERVQSELFAAGGAFVNAWADYDGDFDPDQFVGFEGLPNRLYRNVDGRFEDVAPAAGLADLRPTRAAAWGDADADGDPDLLVGFADSPVLKFFRNTKGVFRDETDAVGLRVEAGAVRQPVWVDYDGDRDLDLFVAFRDRANAMYRNDGGRFVDVATAIGLADTRRTVGAAWFDHDEDGDLDVITGNMDGDANALFSQNDGKFEDVARSAGVEWGGRLPQDKSNGTVRPCVADVDNDGHFDLFFANYGKNGLFLNRGKGRFDNVSPIWGIDIDARYDTCAFADMDNDGDLDLYVNGTVTGGKQYEDYLFRNTGTKFERVTGAEIGSPDSDHGAQWIDFDLDGDADLSLTGVQKNGLHWLLRNTLQSNEALHVMNVRALDENGRATLAGAEITVSIGAPRDGVRQRARLIDAGSGYNSQNDAPVQIVLPRAEEIRLNLTVRRPGTIVAHSVTVSDPARWRDRVFDLRLTRTPSPEKDAVVPVHEEPRHRVVYDTRGTRILDIQIPPGDTTLFHTHSDPILYVTMSTSRTRSQNLGAEWSAPATGEAAAQAAITPTTPPGRMMSTTSYADKPQTHRVNNIGASLFRLIGVTNSSAGDASEEASAGFDRKPEISNRWFRGYRHMLNDTAAEHRHANPVAIVVVSGTASVGNGADQKTLQPGAFAFIEANGRHTLRALAPDAQVVEVEVRRPR